MLRSQEASRFVRRAIECSYDIAPDDPGLAYEELLAAGDRLGFRPGELGDALRRPDVLSRLDRGRFMVDSSDAILVIQGFDRWPWRTFEGFDFVQGEFLRARAEFGEKHARIGREALLARAEARGIDGHAVRVAIAWYLAADAMQAQGETLSGRHQITNAHQAPSEMARHHTVAPKHVEDVRGIFDVVVDVIARRADGRPSHADPLEAFGSLLPRLGHGAYTGWWRRQVSEWKRLAPQDAPTASIVLAASLCEAALTFVADRASETGKTLSGDLTHKPKTKWGFGDLIREAKRGSAPIFDDDLHRRCERLNERRQRIHVGKYIRNVSTRLRQAA